jgi:hypothetical protein
MKRSKQGVMMVLHAVDDQLYFATHPELKEWFEKASNQRFDVTMLGQATWYLQSRITQLADYSIILDQSRYAALVTTRYLLPLNHDGIKLQRKAMYASPLLALPAFTKNDCSDNYAAVMRLQEEFNFEYAAAIGSHVWLMDTFVKLCFAFRKLAKFMQYPGRHHFVHLHHLLNHIKCHRCTGGIKFYSDTKLSPLYQLIVDSGNAQFADAPIIQFTDLSFQDCPDTNRSTGGNLTFIQGAVVEAVSTMPILVSQSTCEAEYCMASLCVMAGSYIKKVFNEISGHYSDRPLTIPVGTDSQSAMDTVNSPKETNRTRHIVRRLHFVRHCIGNGMTTLFKVQGTSNPTSCLTKPLSAQALQLEAKIFQTEVDP